MRMTSPGVLLIVAVAAVGGILMLDVFCLMPYVDNQRDAALRQQSIKTEAVARMVLRDRESALLSTCRTWPDPSDAKQLFQYTGSQADFTPLAKRLFAFAGGQLAWWQSPSGDVICRWIAPGQSDAISDLVEQATASNTGGSDSGFMLLGEKVVIFAKADVASGERSPSGQIFLTVELDSKMLGRIGQAMDAELVYIPQELPDGMNGGDSTPHVFWPVGDEKIAVAWAIEDISGRPLGYLRAQFPVTHIRRQAVLARRVILIILSLSVGLALLVIMGTHILVAGPIVRLLDRLQNIGDERPDSEALTRDLHGEPLVMARRLLTAFDELAHVSRTDELTDLANRRHFEQVLRAFYHQARRYNRQLSLIILDVDFFKAVNDAGGHQIGDKLLKTVARCIEECCRQSDLPARIGGDEFAVLLPETGVKEARAVCQRIANLVSEHHMASGQIKLKVTLSVGIADLNVGQIDSPEAMIHQADKALYEAKENGRNQVVIAHDVGDVSGDKTRTQESGKVDMLQKKLAGLDSRFKGVFIQAVQEIMELLEQRDPNMADHARKVRRYALLICREMELPDRLTSRVQIAAMLHDIGMVAMPDAILLNPGKLTDAQAKAMQRHALLSVRIMEGMQFLEQEIPAVRYHHERFDGEGYPEGLLGAAIPLTARILAVADCFDAMTSPRTFRKAMSCPEAIKELQLAVGSQFDPAVVAAFQSVAIQMGEDLIDYVPDASLDMLAVAASVSSPG